jgi:NtrC-family two-component system response regulator AlgB
MDILPLAEHLLGFFAKQVGKRIDGFTDEAKAALTRYPWPGNLRELRNAIERGVILASGPQVGLTELPAQIGAKSPPRHMELGGGVTLDELEAEHMRRILASTTTLDEAATILGVDPSTLYRKRKRYGL